MGRLLLAMTALPLAASHAGGGLYFLKPNPPSTAPGAPAEEKRPGDVAGIISRLRHVRGYGPPDDITIKEPTAHRRDYQKRVAELRETAKKRRLTPEEQTDLGAYLARLMGRELEEAFVVLRGAIREADEETETYFCAHANLGTVEMLRGDWHSAQQYLAEAERWARRRKRPEAEIEQYKRKLARLREQSSARPGTAPLDALFDAEFVGPDGRWDVGTMAADQVARLPGGSIDEAIRIVEQLLLALPFDARLHWLLGELANAKGDTRAAFDAMQLAVDDFRLSTPELKQRRLILDQYVTWETVLGRIPVPEHRAARLAEIITAASGGTGPGGQEVILAAAVGRLPLEPEAAPAKPYDWLSQLGWPHWLAIGLAAVLVGGLLFLQFRQYLPRRRLAGAAPVERLKGNHAPGVPRISQDPASDPQSQRV